MEFNYNVRPYIVLNGVNSQTIPGLIISKLPPISKPLQRTLVETVDIKIYQSLGFKCLR